MLEFEVVNQKIKRIDNFEVVSDSKNYLKAHFTFSDEWKGDITAIFGYEDKYYTVLLESGECTVPWEVIKPYGFSVSVVCGDRITSNCEVVIVEKSGYIEGETPKAPTPDVYEQILSSVKSAYIGDNGNWFEWNVESKAFVDTGLKAKGEDNASFAINLSIDNEGNFVIDKTFDEIRSGVKDKKEPLIFYDDQGVFKFEAATDTECIFSAIAFVDDRLAGGFIIVDKNNNVTFKEWLFEDSQNKVTKIIGDETHSQYPSAPAVKEYVDRRLEELILGGAW